MSARSNVKISGDMIGAIFYTDSRATLTEALGLRDGVKIGAIEEIITRVAGIDLGG